jgi:hypothetical protein
MILKQGLELGVGVAAVLLAETAAFAPSTPSFLPKAKPLASSPTSLHLYVEDDSFATPPGE